MNIPFRFSTAVLTIKLSKEMAFSVYFYSFISSWFSLHVLSNFPILSYFTSSDNRFSFPFAIFSFSLHTFLTEPHNLCLDPCSIDQKTADIRRWNSTFLPTRAQSRRGQWSTSNFLHLAHGSRSQDWSGLATLQHFSGRANQRKVWDRGHSWRCYRVHGCNHAGEKLISSIRFASKILLLWFMETIIVMIVILTIFVCVERIVDYTL